jgi:hypothetical protein
MRGCVLAGVWGTGKSEIYRRVLTTLTSRGCDHLLALPQAASVTTCTYRPGTPQDHAAALLSWLQTLTDYLQEVDTRFRTSSLPRHRFAEYWAPTLLAEGLGFDVPVYDLPVARDQLATVEDRLAMIGVALVVLYVPPPLVQQQSVVETRHHRGPRWARYLATFGADDASIAARIASRQDELLRWARTTPMPTHVISTQRRQWQTYAEQVTRLITGNGRASLSPPRASRPIDEASTSSPAPSPKRPPGANTRPR